MTPGQELDAALRVFGVKRQQNTLGEAIGFIGLRILAGFVPELKKYGAKHWHEALS